MIRVTTFAGSTVAVFGLGSSGIATARALIEGGATVAAWDDGEAGRAGATKAGIPLVDLKTADWSQFAALVLAPGVPLTHPEPHWVVLKARAAGVEVIGDIELFFRERAKVRPDARVVAITGTNGKSTTTALIAHILREGGHDVQMGGNIGVPVLALEPFAPDSIYVLELSSFQIDLTPSLEPTIGVLLNITPDHLDRHGPADDAALALSNYAAIKERLVLAARHAVVGTDDAWCREIASGLAKLGRPLTCVSVSMPDDVHAHGGQLFRKGHSDPVADLAGISTLRGAHNAQNSAMALAACSALIAVAGAAPPQTHPWGFETQPQTPTARRSAPVVQESLPFSAALKTYPGLPHRMEEVGTLEKPGGRVLFINDSKATNADSTAKALASWERDIFIILGGKPKQGGITSLAAYFPRITKAYLIGQATEEFAATLEGKVPYERRGTLGQALAAATRDAAASTGSEPVILLSPACASYDQFRSFEHRGDEFRRMVQALPGIVTKAHA